MHDCVARYCSEYLLYGHAKASHPVQDLGLTGEPAIAEDIAAGITKQSIMNCLAGKL
jgi:hypothetical protein